VKACTLNNVATVTIALCVTADFSRSVARIIAVQFHLYTTARYPARPYELRIVSIYG